MTSDIGRSSFFSKRRSRLVTIPKRQLFSSTMGIPPILYFAIFFLASFTIEFMVNTTGSMIIPDSALLTILTLLACSFMVMFLCKTPMPPSCAIAMAILLSVTVSMAAEIMGTFSEIFLENREVIETSLGSTSEKAGTNKTSS